MSTGVRSYVARGQTSRYAKVSHAVKRMKDACWETDWFGRSLNSIGERDKSVVYPLNEWALAWANQKTRTATNIEVGIQWWRFVCSRRSSVRLKQTDSKEDRAWRHAEDAPKQDPIFIPSSRENVGGGATLTCETGRQKRSSFIRLSSSRWLSSLGRKSFLEVEEKRHSRERARVHRKIERILHRSREVQESNKWCAEQMPAASALSTTRASASDSAIFRMMIPYSRQLVASWSVGLIEPAEQFLRQSTAYELNTMMLASQ